MAEYKYKDREKEYKAAWYQTNKKRLDKKNRQWQKDNPEKFAAMQKKYRETPNGRKAAKGRQERYRGSEKSNRRFRKQNLKHNYGLSLEDYDQMVENQNGVCAICGGINKSGRRLVIDHDHKTGKIRGLLCNNCNIGIGNLQEDIDILSKSIIYLRKYL